MILRDPDTQARWPRKLGGFVGLLEENYGLDPEALGQSFDGLEGEVALSSLDLADVGPVETEFVGKGFLAKTEAFAFSPEVLPDPALEVVIHLRDSSRLILEGLQTLEYHSCFACQFLPEQSTDTTSAFYADLIANTWKGKGVEFEATKRR